MGRQTVKKKAGFGPAGKRAALAGWNLAKTLHRE
jgi:hypothetical protein